MQHVAYQLSDSSSAPPCIGKEGGELTKAFIFLPIFGSETACHHSIYCSIHPFNLLHHL
jgi:hypothetical protein